MKRIVCALVLLTLVFTVFAGGAESAEQAEAEGAAVISFSSFSGGGYEYTVEAEDPSVLQCEIRYEFEPNAEELDGATYDCLVILKGTTAPALRCGEGRPSWRTRTISIPQKWMKT